MTDPIVVLCLLLTTSTLAVLGADMDKYRRENGTFANAPSATLSATSVMTCAISCTSVEPLFCGGFTYHSGTCDLYRDNEEGTLPLKVDAGAEPRGYRRLYSTDQGEAVSASFFCLIPFEHTRYHVANKRIDWVELVQL